MSSSAASAGGSLRVITGPPGAGKSALVMALAARAPITIVSADSRQVYRGFDIGTAKPTPEERARVPHEGLDLIAPAERYSAAAWAEAAGAAIERAHAAGRIPVIVGGTGFYIRALVAPLFAEPPLDPARRAALAAELASAGTDALRARVERLDPARAQLGRAQLLRAVEVAELTGRPLSAWHAERAGAPPRRARYLVVDPGAALRNWIPARVARMLDGGWPEEVRALLASVPEEAPAWTATGYEWVRDLVRGRVAREAAAEGITVATRQYAKRQRTWFRHQLAGERVTALDPAAADAERRALDWFLREDGA